MSHPRGAAILKTRLSHCYEPPGVHRLGGKSSEINILGTAWTVFSSCHTMDLNNPAASFLSSLIMSKSHIACPLLEEWTGLLPHPGPEVSLLRNGT